MRIERDNLDGVQPYRWGLILLQVLTLFLFMTLALRFWFLQVLMGENFERQSHSNRYKSGRIAANRGLVLDDQGVILAENSTAYSVAIVRESCPDVFYTLGTLSQLLGLPLEEVTRAYNDEVRRNPTQQFAQLIVVPSINYDQLQILEGNSYRLAGVEVISRQRRYYTNGPLFAHVLGYVSVADKEDLKKFTGLDRGDSVGKQGLEVVLEDRLRGKKGQNRIEVDAHGRQLSKMQVKSPTGGEDIRLSLDVDLQKAAMDALMLKGEAGCIVVMEPDTGKLRALVTAPSYDNNIFTDKLSPEDWSKLRDNPRHPLQNRVIQSVYPPGSVWKLLMAGMLLSEGVNPKETVHCSGAVRLGNRTFRCWKKGGHGRVDMTRSLVESCDVYYYLMGDRMGIDRITKYGEACGFGRRTGIVLPQEKGGLVPSRTWKKAVRKESWQKGETYNVSIGQGFTLVTPVQMAVYVSALLNGGKLLEPLVIDTDTPVVTGELPYQPQVREFLVDAMKRTVDGPGATARRLMRKDAIMGGKTGTAQVVKLGEKRVRASEMAYEHRDHAWMASWGIKGNKRYVVVVMVEHGGGGSSAAGPVCKDVYEYLFSDEPKVDEFERNRNVSGYVVLEDTQHSEYTEEVIRAAQGWLPQE